MGKTVNLLVFVLLWISCNKDARKPEACFSSSTDGGIVTFTSSCSKGAETWDWDFGDGGSSIGENPTHEYEEPGTYTVTLRIASSKSKIATESTQITIAQVCVDLDCYLNGSVYFSAGFCGTKQTAEAYCAIWDYDPDCICN